uniref:ly6/PLAUR domain-containing protein 6 isoform X1 n=1 Tax=Doryrhamphus excisus TaxID=161450 RepID=UPI0025ADDB80|nr:ly6/PLAUR domain-containing protein 6 isoform X1 [Doryrhamphus excisus]
MNIDQRCRSVHSQNDSPIEPKHLRCSNLNMPLLASEFFKSELQLHLDGMTTEMWDLIEYGHFDRNAFMVLLKMWQSILCKISQEVLVVVVPQVEEHAQIIEKGCDTPIRALNYSCVTEDDIHACIWDSLLLALKDAINAGDIKLPCGDQLLEMVAAKVSHTVNTALSNISSPPTPLPHPDVPHQVSEIGEIALQTISVLKSCLETMRQDGDAGCEEECVDSDSSEETTNGLVAPLPTPVLNRAQRNLKTHTPAKVRTRTENISNRTPAETWTKKENTFCTVFLWKLTDHIAHSNSKSVLEMDIDWMLTHLMSAVVETRPNLLLNIGDFHIHIYKDLCQEFGSKERLYCSMARCQLVFVEALARAMRHHLKAPKKRDFFTKVRAFFKKKTAKVSLAYEQGHMWLQASNNTKKL